MRRLTARAGTRAGIEDWKQSGIGLRRRVLITAVALLSAVVALTGYLISRGQQSLIEFQAVQLAEIVTRQSASSRSVYAEHVVGKLTRDGVGVASEHYKDERGNVPLPAQFLKLVGERIGIDSRGLYRYRPVSKWNLAPDQGLADDFQRWAWARLETQDLPATAPIAWDPVWRIETVEGVSTLRYMRADPAVSAACVNCHNALESRPQTLANRARGGVPAGKVFEVNRLMGAIEVQVPLDRVAAMARDHSQVALLSVLLLALGGMLCIGYFVYADVSRARALNHELAWQASHDALTGLINRRHFERKLGMALEDAQVEASRHALMFLDLDQFKVVNDTSGHTAGDELLRQLGALLKSQLRANDTLARLGGDEFGVLVAHCDLPKAREIAEKLRQVVAGFRFSWGNRLFETGVSIGLVPIDVQSKSVAQLMSAADVACYAAKEGGRNRIHVLKASDGELGRRTSDLEWGTRIGDALREERVFVEVQKAVALRPELAVTEYREALLRMHDRDHTPVPTSALIQAAERYNLMPGRIDRFVVRTVCRLIAEGSLPADARRIVALNLSGTSLGDEEFLRYVRTEIAAARVAPEVLCFEVTETAAINNLAHAIRFMNTLRGLGCRFALDDFGTGVSSFGYLKNLPVDFLKIDGEFVRNIANDPVDRAMVTAICGVGRAMGIPTVAEWVETDAVLRVVRELGVDYAQGFRVARPEPIPGHGPAKA
ncbi:MAG TPA: EAL domain-containing protein [Burkholderiales bacterium]